MASLLSPSARFGEWPALETFKKSETSQEINKGQRTGTKPGVGSDSIGKVVVVEMDEVHNWR